MVIETPVIADGGLMLLEREITVVPYIANTRQQVTIRLRPNMLKHFVIHLAATIETDVPGLNINDDFPWAGIRRITVYTQRGEILKSVSGRQLHFLNLFEGGTNEYSTWPASLDPATINAYADLMVPFENKTGLDPEETVLNSNEFTELFISIEWLDYLNQAYEETLVSFSMVCTLVFLEREPFSVSDKLQPRKKLVDQDFWISIVNDRFEYLLPENTLIKTIQMMNIQDDQAAWNERINMIQYVSIEDDDNAHLLRQWTGAEIQSANKQYYGIEGGQVNGIYVIEFDQLRDLTSLYSTFNIAYPKLVIQYIPGPYLLNQQLGLFIRQVTTPPTIRRPVGVPSIRQAISAPVVPVVPVIPAIITD